MRILLDNALRHTPDGTDVTVSAARANGHAPAHRGRHRPGHPVGDRQVFERFYTGDAVRGAGLGLAIARELANRMSGATRARPHAGHDRLHARAAGRSGPDGTA